MESATADLGHDNNVPIIDLAGLKAGDEASRLKIVHELGKAAKAWGIFTVINHGVPVKLMNTLQEESLQFFNLSDDVRKGFKTQNPDLKLRLLGYQELYAKTQVYKDLPVKQSLAGFRPTPSNTSDIDVNLWPSWTSPLREAIAQHDNAVHALGVKILELLAESLGLEPNIFSKHFVSGSVHVGQWRLHRFPKHPDPPDVLRTVHHSDPTVLTLVRQDVEGLQVKKSDNDDWLNDWLTIEALPEAYIVNVGDILEAWTNSQFPSANHRVVLNPMTERFSTVNFLEVGPSVCIEAPMGVIDETHPALYFPFSASAFRNNFDKIKPSRNITQGMALRFALRNPKIKANP